MTSLRCSSVAFLLYLAFSLSSAAPLPSLVRIVTDEGSVPRRSGEGYANEVYCDSWRLAVETNNVARWRTIPAMCVEFVKDYMNRERYAADSEMVAAESMAFAKRVPIAGDGKDVSEIYNETAWDKWVYLAKAPALQASLNLYDGLLGLGYQIVLLTGRSEKQRNITEENLLSAGYHSWNQLILRQTSDIGKSAVVYKSEKRTKLEAQGFRIHGCSGDQWSDLMGSPMGKRSFKLPNPMYFIA